MKAPGIHRCTLLSRVAWRLAVEAIGGWNKELKPFLGGSAAGSVCGLRAFVSLVLQVLLGNANGRLWIGRTKRNGQNHARRPVRIGLGWAVVISRKYRDVLAAY